jgi:hypothetical protein
MNETHNHQPDLLIFITKMVSTYDGGPKHIGLMTETGREPEEIIHTIERPLRNNFFATLKARQKKLLQIKLLNNLIKVKEILVLGHNLSFTKQLFS